MKKLSTTLALAILIAIPASSSAAAQVVIAPPGSQLSGLYLAPTTVAVKAQAVTFVNLDVAATGAHNIRSVAVGPNGAPWCGAYPSGSCPLFVSALVSAGQTSTADLRNTAVGQSYEFYCSLHLNMRGTLQVVA